MAKLQQEIEANKKLLELRRNNLELAKKIQERQGETVISTNNIVNREKEIRRIKSKINGQLALQNKNAQTFSSIEDKVKKSTQENV